MNKPTTITLIVALAAMTTGVLMEITRQTPEIIEAAAKPIDFSFPDASDRMQSISQWRGKVLVINFWATWCAPCLKEIPEFMKLQAEYPQRGLQFIGVAIDEKQPVSDYLQSIEYQLSDFDRRRCRHRFVSTIRQYHQRRAFHRYCQSSRAKWCIANPARFPRDKLLEIVTPLIVRKAKTDAGNLTKIYGLSGQKPTN